MVACSQMHVCGRKLNCLERTHTAMCDHVTTAGKTCNPYMFTQELVICSQISSMKNPSTGAHSHFCLCKHTFACRITVNKDAFLWLCVSALALTNPFPPFLSRSSPDPSISHSSLCGPLLHRGDGGSGFNNSLPLRTGCVSIAGCCRRE